MSLLEMIFGLLSLIIKAGFWLMLTLIIVLGLIYGFWFLGV